MDTTATIGWGIAGTGRIARTVLDDFAHVPGARISAVLPLRIDDLNVPVPQPFQVLLDEWPDINVPGPFRVATMGNVGRKGHSPILPAKINSHRGRLDT